MFTAAAVLWELLKLLLLLLYCVYITWKIEKINFYFSFTFNPVAFHPERNLVQRETFLVAHSSWWEKKIKSRKKWARRGVEKKFNRWSHVISSSKEQRRNASQFNQQTKTNTENTTQPAESFSHFLFVSFFPCYDAGLYAGISSESSPLLCDPPLIRRKWNENSSKQFTQQWHMESGKIECRDFHVDDNAFLSHIYVHVWQTFDQKGREKICLGWKSLFHSLKNLIIQKHEIRDLIFSITASSSLFVWLSCRLQVARCSLSRHTSSRSTAAQSIR